MTWVLQRIVWPRLTQRHPGTPAQGSMIFSFSERRFRNRNLLHPFAEGQVEREKSNSDILKMCLDTTSEIIA
jgi:hypothetical protein